MTKILRAFVTFLLFAVPYVETEPSETRARERGPMTRPYVPDRFAARVLTVVRRIPSGRVATYGDVAAMAGRARAWRAVGNIMRGCTAVGVPCHRVVAAGGRLGGYGGATGLKRQLLLAEGVVASATRVRDFEARRWRR